MAFAELAELTATIGFEEIAVFWPWNDDERAVFEHESSHLSTLAS